MSQPELRHSVGHEDAVARWRREADESEAQRAAAKRRRNRDEDALVQVHQLYCMIEKSERDLKDAIAAVSGLANAVLAQLEAQGEELDALRKMVAKDTAGIVDLPPIPLKRVS
jgi:hypothetical protein